MKNIQTLEELDELMCQEKRALVDEIFNDAWQEAIDQGIEADIVARGALRTAIKSSVDANGQEDTRKLANEVEFMIETGSDVPSFLLT